MYRNFNNNILPELMRRRRPMRRRNFIPNLGRGRRNLPIRFINPRTFNQPRRNLNRRKINNQNNKQNNLIQQMPNNFLVNRLQSSTSKGKDSFHFYLKVPNYNAGSIVSTIPVHPLFLNQRLLNMSLNFSQYKITNLLVHTTPLVPTTDTAAITIGYTTHCTPMTNDTAQIFDKICNLNGYSSMCWMPNTFKIPNTPNDGFHPIIPVVPSDLPYTIFIATPANDPDGKVAIYLEFDIKFAAPYTGDEFDNVVATSATTFTLTNGGITALAAIATSFGFCVVSTVPSIDLGELIIVPSFVDNQIHLDHFIFHNGNQTTSTTEVADRGVLTPVLKTIH